MPRPWREEYVALILLITAVSGHGHRCRFGKFEAGGRCCPKCRPGYYVGKNCTELNITNCLPCGVGTYMNDINAQTQCDQCNTCEGSGLKVNRTCTERSDSVCEAQEGFYCTDVKDDSCVRAQKHRNCDKGQYIKRKGNSSADTECSSCTNGTFSDGTFTQCRPHTQCESLNQQLVNPGTSSTDAECVNKRRDRLVGLSLSLIVAAVVVFSVFYWRKKKIRERRREQVF